jgi:hypothetical protein
MVDRVLAGHRLLRLLPWLALFGSDGHRPASESEEPKADRREKDPALLLRVLDLGAGPVDVWPRG